MIQQLFLTYRCPFSSSLKFSCCFGRSLFIIVLAHLSLLNVSTFNGVNFKNKSKFNFNIKK
jgi:hypothetical protein